VVSHELRTPLNAMYGWVRMLSRGQLDAASTQGALEAIERNTTLQAKLIEDLLDVSRIITGKLTLQAELLDLGQAGALATKTPPAPRPAAGGAAGGPGGGGRPEPARADLQQPALERGQVHARGGPRARSRRPARGPGGDHGGRLRPGHQGRVHAAPVRALPPGGPL